MPLIPPSPCISPVLFPPLQLALSSSLASYRRNMAAAESRDVTTPAVAPATRVTANEEGEALPRRTTCCLYIQPSGSRCAEHNAARVPSSEDLRAF